MESGVRFESLKKNYEQTVRKEKIKGTRIGGKKKKEKKTERRRRKTRETDSSSPYLSISTSLR